MLPFQVPLWWHSNVHRITLNYAKIVSNERMDMKLKQAEFLDAYTNGNAR